ncbi:MAG: thiopurine S-methyltransferase [Kofleriaceae bacterium]|nr:thiopurine S-methyltransferase [Kofleriaceae bacterium]
MKNLWHSRWQEGKIGFHNSDVHSDLLTYASFLDDGPHRVLVPLCGKSVDMIWLAEQGHEVVGVELVPLAVEQFFSDKGLSPEIQKQGAVQLYRAGSITILCGDIFDIDQSHIGEIDRVWDRAALVALPRELRSSYVSHLRSIALDNARFMINVFRYDTSVMDGPPHSISDEEIQEYFAGRELSLLSEQDKLSDYPLFEARGHKYWNVCTYSA